MAVVSGGTTLIDNGALDAGVSTGSLILLSTQTASASASLEFSMDSTYDSYVFKYINMHPATDAAYLEFQGSTNNGSSYGVTITSTFFEAYHNEADTATTLSYAGYGDLAQSTSFQTIIAGIGNDADQSCVGTLQIFNPSSNTFVKHFLARGSRYSHDDYASEQNLSGYFNTTSPITNLKFQFSSGNIDDGIIKMYGVK
jgi:hypothetical protein